MFHVGMSIKQGRGSTYLFRQGSGLLQKVDFFSTKDYFIFRWGMDFGFVKLKNTLLKIKLLVCSVLRGSCLHSGARSMAVMKPMTPEVNVSYFLENNDFSYR